MQEELKKAIAQACQELFGVTIEPELTRPDEKFGDYATNAAMQLGGNPRESAGRLEEYIRKLDGVKSAEVAGPGFINIRLTDDKIAKAAASATRLAQPLAGQTVVAEYSDPNPFKILHAGHLYTSVVGDAIANLCEAAGANVHRVNFGGDVGLHVAKAMWSIIKKLGGENPAGLDKIPKKERADWMSDAYVKGNNAYEDEAAAKQEIIGLNKKIYEIQRQKDEKTPLAKIYWTCRSWSYEYFEDFYKTIGSGFEKYYPESVTVEPGLKAVRTHIGKVFEESEGAVVFKGEVHNMHTRVFITSQGLPTYETKDVGLILKKWQDYHFDKSIVITSNEIYEYMQVVLKAIEQINPELAKKTVHLTHGIVKLAGGEKMSSRKGNILRASDILEAAAKANKELSGQDNPQVELGAVKYAFLKQSIGPDIIYDPKESVVITGNSGPYIQYAHARACSILAKAEGKKPSAGSELNESERSLARKISEYPEIVSKAVNELMPSHVCTYLYELAQAFNRFYETNRVIGDEREALRLELVRVYADVLKHGLGILNIKAPEKI